MPYFLRVDNEGVARIGGTFRDRPGDDWHQGSESNYLQRWDGSQWIDTPIAELLRQAQAADAIASKEEDKRQQKASLRGKDMRVLRAVAKVLVKKIPGYNWQQFLADFDAIIDAD